ncbi:MAG TPA: hypothetical protein VII31_07410 [Caldimonas sp.]|jgi:hypothetical protein
MSNESQDGRRIAAALARKVQAGADAIEIAGTVTAAVTGVAASLSPIIGRGGVVALFRRSLHLVGPAYPWLGSSDNSRSEIDAQALGALLAERGAADAAVAGGALLQTFSDLLVSLVGASLGYRLLQPAWETLSIDPALPDTSP